MVAQFAQKPAVRSDAGVPGNAFSSGGTKSAKPGIGTRADFNNVHLLFSAIILKGASLIDQRTRSALYSNVAFASHDYAIRSVSTSKS